MDNPQKPSCQWFQCSEPAERHVKFGLRVFDVEKSDDIFGLPYNPEFRDLCAYHIAAIRRHYVYVEISDLEYS